MSITNGGLVSSEGFAYIAPLAGASGVVTVDGANSTWALYNTGKLLIGTDVGASGNGGTALLKPPMAEPLSSITTLSPRTAWL
jgi:T5SS/PEP-CTERM-associated repeat protein